MYAEFKCANCGAVLKVRKVFAARAVQCPKCGKKTERQNSPGENSATARPAPTSAPSTPKPATPSAVPVPGPAAKPPPESSQPVAAGKPAAGPGPSVSAVPKPSLSDERLKTETARKMAEIKGRVEKAESLLKQALEALHACKTGLDV